MDATAWTTVIAIAVSAGLQFAKERLKLGSESLRWVAAVIGALAGGGAGYAGGAVSAPQIVTSLGLGAVVMTGFHSLVLQNSMAGRLLKELGSAFFDALLKSPSPPAPPATP